MDGAVSRVHALPSPGPAGERFDRVPPHNLDAEVSVVGSMLLDKDAIAEVTEIVGPEDFYRGAHRTMFEAIRDLYDRGEPVDAITLGDELSKRGKLDDIGGQVAVADILSRVPTSANALHYARIVAAQALRRRLIETGTQITRIGYDDTEGIDEAVDTAEQLVYNVAQHGRVSEFTPMKELLTEGFAIIEKLHENNSAITGLATGFTDFDELTSGLQPSNLVILAARPAMGKSTLVTNMAVNVAVEQRKPAVLFSLEMSKMELVQRVLAAEARVDSDRLRTGRLQESDWPKLSQAMGRLAEAPLFIDDTPGINMMEIRSKSRRLKQKHGLDLIIVDYLQLMQSHRRFENRVQEVSELSRGLKILAKELDVPVIALSQLSRRPEERTDRRPQLADLRESGCLTADARVLRADTGAEVTMGELHASGERDIPVWSVDHDYKVVQATMSHVFSTGVKETFRLTLASGREITASANHPFLTYDGWARLDELAEGSRLAVPRSIPAPATTTVLDDREVILLAHLLGGGCVAPLQPIQYTSNDPANLDALEAAARHFGITPRRVQQKASWHTYLPAPQKLTHGRRNPIAKWLDERFGLYGTRSHEKFIPAEVFGLKDPQVALFLRHLWATDGHLGRCGRQVRLSYTSSSRRLVDDLQQLLLRLGIHGRIHEVAHEVAGKDGHRHHRLWISSAADQIRFLEEIGVHGRRGERVAELLAYLRSATPVSKADTVPSEVWRFIHDERRRMGMTVEQLRIASGLQSIGHPAATHGPSRVRVAALAAALDSEGLRLLATSDLYWDRVVAIEPLGPQEVFDATVSGTHNFVANNIVVENSIEQDADIVAFIYRDEVYNPDTAAKGEAELIVSKHRSGPLKTIHLAFLGSTSRFANLRRGPGPGGAPPPPGPPGGPL
jgi:replicative DNA helicase